MKMKCRDCSLVYDPEINDEKTQEALNSYCCATHSYCIEFEKIYNEAVEAGMAALKAKVPTPMVVVQHKNMLDDTSPVEKAYNVPMGMCGFAWINIKPATQPFVRWLKKQAAGNEHTNYGFKDSYYGGWSIWAHEGGQSIELKQAFCEGFGKVLSKYLIENYTMSRLD